MARLNRPALAAALLLALAGCGKEGPAGGAAGDPAVLNFSILSAEDQAAFEPLWKPLLDDLGKATGKQVKPYFSPNYTALVTAMKFNQTQMGWFSAKPAWEAVKRSEGEVFARTVDLTGHDDYQSVVIVKKGSGITLDRILKCDRTLSFGLGDAQSTSGTLAPMHYLFGPKDIDPSKCFKVVRSSSHQGNLFSVANGQLDASTNNSVGLDFAREGAPNAKAAFDRIAVVWTSPDLPESALVFRKDLDPALRARIKAFFTAYGQGTGPEAERQRAILKPLHYSAFHAAGDDYLQPIADMAKEEEAKADARTAK